MRLGRDLQTRNDAIRLRPAARGAVVMGVVDR